MGSGKGSTMYTLPVSCLNSGLGTEGAGAAPLSFDASLCGWTVHSRVNANVVATTLKKQEGIVNLLYLLEGNPSQSTVGAWVAHVFILMPNPSHSHSVPPGKHA